MKVGRNTLFMNHIEKYSLACGVLDTLNKTKNHENEQRYKQAEVVSFNAENIFLNTLIPLLTDGLEKQEKMALTDWLEDKLLLYAIACRRKKIALERVSLDAFIKETIRTKPKLSDPDGHKLFVINILLGIATTVFTLIASYCLLQSAPLYGFLGVISMLIALTTFVLSVFFPVAKIREKNDYYEITLPKYNSMFRQWNAKKMDEIIMKNELFEDGNSLSV